MTREIVSVTSRAGKRAYRKLFLRLRQILNQWDPMGLIACGAPQDEYEPEVGTLIGLLPKSSQQSLAEAWRNDLQRWFMTRPAWPGLTEASQQVWEAWLESQRDCADGSVLGARPVVELVAPGSSPRSTLPGQRDGHTDKGDE